MADSDEKSGGGWAPETMYTNIQKFLNKSEFKKKITEICLIFSQTMMKLWFYNFKYCCLPAIATRIQFAL